MQINIYCVHEELEKNILCEHIETDICHVFKCPKCQREIVMELK